MFNSLVHCPHDQNIHYMASLKMGTGDSVPVFHVSGRDPVTGALSAVPQGLYLCKAGVRSQTWAAVKKCFVLTKLRIAAEAGSSYGLHYPSLRLASQPPHPVAWYSGHVLIIAWCRMTGFPLSFHLYSGLQTLYVYSLTGPMEKKRACLCVLLFNATLNIWYLNLKLSHICLQ